MQNRIYKTELVEWQKVKDLQPDNLKLPYNYEHIKKSILKHGISKAYDVCELEGELYWIDGHTRTQILMELVSDDVDVPEMLTANFCRVKDRKEAIEILLEVHNQRQNPIAEEVLSEWIDVEMVEVAVESLNVKVVEDLHSFSDSDEYSTNFSLPEGDKSPFQQMTFTLADEQAEQVKNAIADIKKTDEYKYAETMGNENSNGNALYLIIMQWAGQRK